MAFRNVCVFLFVSLLVASSVNAIADDRERWLALHHAYTAALEAGEYKQAETVAREQFQFAKEHPLPHEEDNVSRQAHSLNQIAGALIPQGDLATAKKLLTQSLEMNVALRGPTSKHLIPILLRLAEVNRQQGQIEEAAETLRQAMRVKEVALTWQKKDEAFVELAELLNAQCAMMIAQREIDDARKTAERAVSIKVPLPDSEQQQLAINLSQLGSLLRDQGESAQAVSCLEEARIRYGKVADADRAKFANCLEHLASLYREAGRDQDAEKVEAQLESVRAADSQRA
ncbi:MAG: tetratricopeptide repeat protein [Pirellulales bacterium]|nr:tetratricopeptide repeat protein [Pirellulales bacterium]